MSGPDSADDCVFCRIAAGDERPAGSDGLLADLGATVVFTPMHPVTAGHVLVVPKAHVADAGDHPSLTGLTFAAAARWCSEWTDAFNLITSVGHDATQKVRHLAVHAIPRCADDGLVLPWTGQQR